MDGDGAHRTGRKSGRRRWLKQERQAGRARWEVRAGRLTTN